MDIYEHVPGVRTRWVSFEGQSVARGKAGLENQGAKGHAFDSIRAGETKTLLDCRESGKICRIWLTIDDRSAEMLRSLRLEMFWDHSEHPAVSVPLGDFFMAGLGRLTPYQTPLLSNPEGRSFNCFIPMPFRKSARITLTNDSDKDLVRLFYDIDLVVGVKHSPEVLYFHSHWRRESPNQLGHEYDFLPLVHGRGRFLGVCAGVQVNPIYEHTWWGEGEVKVRFDGDANPTLCGTGTEDYIGSGWGQGVYSHRTQGCLVADRDHYQYVFYRHHLDDPIYFDKACRVSIQTMGGSSTDQVRKLIEKGAPALPVTIDRGGVGGFVQLLDGGHHDLTAPENQTGWCNYWRQDDWSSTAYFYLDSPESSLPLLPGLTVRTRDLPEQKNEG